MEYSSVAQSVARSQLSQHRSMIFILQKTKVKEKKATNKQLQMVAAVKTWQSISREETWFFVRSMGSRRQAVIDCKGFHPSIKTYLYIYCYVTLSKHFGSPVNGNTFLMKVAVPQR